MSPVFHLCARNKMLTCFRSTRFKLSTLSSNARLYLQKAEKRASLVSAVETNMVDIPVDMGPQVVILAGRTESALLGGFVSKEQPKCLLPIGGKPLLWYTLQTVATELPKTPEVLIVTDQSHVGRVTDVVASVKQSMPLYSLPTSVIAVASELYSSWTALSELLEKHVTTCAFYLISGDIFGAPLFLKELQSLYAKRVSSKPLTLCSMLLTTSSDRRTSSGTLSGVLDTDKKKGASADSAGAGAPARVVACISEDQVLAIRSFSDVESGGDALKIPLATIQRIESEGARVRVETKFHDAHVYLLNRVLLTEAFQQVARKFQLDSFRLDFLPLLVALQENMVEFSQKENGNVVFHAVSPTPLLKLPLRIQSITTLRELNVKMSCIREDDLKRELAGIFCLPSRTLTLSVTATDCAKSKHDMFCVDPENPGSVHHTAQLKKSSLGRRCIIGERAKVSSSLLLDDVRVGCNAHVADSVLGNSVRVGEHCQLTQCVVENGVNVPPKTSAKRQTFTASLGMNDDENSEDISESENTSL